MIIIRRGRVLRRRVAIERGDVLVRPQEEGEDYEEGVVRAHFLARHYVRAAAMAEARRVAVENQRMVEAEEMMMRDTWGARVKVRRGKGVKRVRK